MLDLLNTMSLGTADGMNSLITTAKSILTWLQRFGIVSCAIGYCVGGYYFIWGGEKGRHQAKVWLIGATVGLVIVMGALGLATGVDNQVKF